PASSQVWMDIRSTEEGNVQMSILNALGQEFGKDQTLWLNTENQIRLETDQWPSGMYTIRLSDGKRNWTGKLVIRR
ncbi:MAG TPA: T9SS type A sorting domain-containing protein, partial [Catalimonadaceae bacterium]|nr:T9SS type A sorting domain-containing protein [Catalimonadaceae bacterium]